MRRVDWTTRALEDLNQIVEYIQDRNFDAAERMRALIEGGADRVALHPFAYRPGRIFGTREAVLHPNYILVFSVRDDAIEIRTVIHARQQFP